MSILMQRSDKILKALESAEKDVLADLQAIATAFACRMKLPPHLEPRDIAQDVFIILFESCRNGIFRGECDIKTYAAQITINVCLKKLRELRRMERVEVDLDNLHSTAPIADEFIEKKESLMILQQVISSLEPKCRDLISLRYQSEMSYSEIAVLRGVKEVTVREQLSRCLKKARELANGLSEEQQCVRKRY